MILIDSLLRGTAPPNYQHELSVLSPVSGQVSDIKDVPDRTLHAGTWGEGLVLRTRATHLACPVKGRIEKLDIDAHRWVIKAKTGLRLMLQLGPPTTPIFGERLGLVKHPGHAVNQGDILTYFDPVFLQQQWGHCFCILTVLNRKGIQAIVPQPINTRLTPNNAALHIYL